LEDAIGGGNEGGDCQQVDGWPASLEKRPNRQPPFKATVKPPKNRTEQDGGFTMYKGGRGKKEQFRGSFFARATKIIDDLLDRTPKTEERTKPGIKRMSD